MSKVIRLKTRDAAFSYRMGAGFPGDVNRTHPASIEPVLIDAAAPPTLYGQPTLIDPTTQGVRPFAAGDTAVTDAYGMTVRPYPTQQESATNYGATGLGTGTPPASGIMDVLRMGYIMAKVNGSTVKGGTVYVWCAASTGSHVQGGLEATASAGNTAALSRVTFNGVPDANGFVEVAFNI
jgi:hypothetical protein